MNETGPDLTAAAPPAERRGWWRRWRRRDWIIALALAVLLAGAVVFYLVRASSELRTLYVLP